MSTTTLLARPRSEYHEDDGPVLWWKFPIVEPPYCGRETDDDFPHYVTHWTPVPVPTGSTDEMEP